MTNPQEVLAAWNQLKQKLSVHQNSTCRNWTLAQVSVSQKELATEKAWREKDKELAELAKEKGELKKWLEMRCQEEWEELEQWAKI